MICPKCSAAVAADDTFCAKCGNKIGARPARKRSTLKIAGYVIGVLLVGGFIGNLMDKSGNHPVAPPPSQPSATSAAPAPTDKRPADAGITSTDWILGTWTTPPSSSVTIRFLLKADHTGAVAMPEVSPGMLAATWNSHSGLLDVTAGTTLMHLLIDTPNHSLVTIGQERTVLLKVDADSPSSPPSNAGDNEAVCAALQNVANVSSLTYVDQPTVQALLTNTHTHSTELQLITMYSMNITPSSGSPEQPTVICDRSAISGFEAVVNAHLKYADGTSQDAGYNRLVLSRSSGHWLLDDWTASDENAAAFASLSTRSSGASGSVVNPSTARGYSGSSFQGQTDHLPASVSQSASSPPTARATAGDSTKATFITPSHPKTLSEQNRKALETLRERQHQQAQPPPPQ